MSRLVSLAPKIRQMAALGACSSSSSSSSLRCFSSFSSSTPSQSPLPPASASAAPSGRRSHNPSSSSSYGANFTSSPPREMPLSELNSRAKELAGQEYEMDADTDSFSLTSSPPMMDPIDSGLEQQTAQGEDNIVFEHMRLQDILRTKERYGSTIHAVNASDRIVAATELMAHMNIGAVLVRDATGKIAGIVSTRDYVRKIQEKGLHPKESLVSEFMTPSPVFAYSDDTAVSCMLLMTKHNFRHLPVKQRKTGKNGEERTVGLVSIGDLVRVMLKQYRDSAIELRAYIDGRYSQS